MATTTNTVSKRTLDALDRRIAAAEADLLHQRQQQQHKRTKLNSTDPKTPAATAPPPPRTPLSTTTAAAPSPSSYSSSKKDVEESGPAYLGILQPVHDSLLRSSGTFQSKRGSVVDKVLHELLQHGDSSQKYMQGSRAVKVDNWILLDNHVKGHGLYTGSHIRALREHSKRSKRHMSMKQLKKCGSFDLPLDARKYDNFKPMHEMWKGYMKQLLKISGKNQLAQVLQNADLHGAIIAVVECKVVSYTGVNGIMIRETAETFSIITEENKFRVVPKKFSVFMFQVDCWRITLHGDKLTSRNLSL